MKKSFITSGPDLENALRLLRYFNQLYKKEGYVKFLVCENLSNFYF